MALLAGIAELRECNDIGADNLENGDTASIVTKAIYGDRMSLRHSTLMPHFHTRPHVHSAEQLRYVAEGSISVFMKGFEYSLRAGDFMNVPPDTVHWDWNRSDAPCVVLDVHSPVELAGIMQPLFDESEGPHDHRPAERCETVWLSYRYAKDETRTPPAPEDDVWWARGERIQSSFHAQMAEAGRLTSKFVYGERANLMVATRLSGYHSKPHAHRCEQLNFALKGRHWLFSNRVGLDIQPGDLSRVPSNASHWIWGDGDEEMLLFEAHSPVLDPSAKPNAYPLLPPDKAGSVTTVVNFFAREVSDEDEAAAMAGYRRPAPPA